MPLQPRRSILRKLTLVNMLVSGAALSLACLAFFTYDQVTFRQSLIRTLSAQADIIGSTSVSAILFADPQSATNTLSALKSSNPSPQPAFLHSIEDRSPSTCVRARMQASSCRFPRFRKGKLKPTNSAIRTWFLYVLSFFKDSPWDSCTFEPTSGKSISA